MSHRRLGAALLAASALLTVVPVAMASGPGGGGGGCTPLAISVTLPHADINGRTGINVQATMQNCSTTRAPLQLAVSVPGSSTVPFKFSAPLQAGGSLTMFASPIGSTPSQLHYGQTYNVVATLTRMGTTPTAIATITKSVTMPPGPVA
jgi:hypothetical protein